MAISIPKKQGESAGDASSRLMQAFQSLRQVRLQIPGAARVSRREVMFFTSQLSLMLETGVPLTLSILAISSQIKNPYFSNILARIVDHLEQGYPLAEALAKYPEAFSPVYISMIRAGEVGGQIKEMLDRLVNFEKRRERVVFALRSAMAYPLFLIFLTVSVIIFILTYIFPKFGDLFDEIRDDLPATTKLLLLSSDVMGQYWPFILLFVAGACWMVWRYIRTPDGKAYFDRLTLSLPMVKGFLQKFYVSNFMRTLGALIGGGVILLEALKVCKGVVASSIFRQFTDRIMQSVEEGKGLAHPVASAPFIPEMVKQMIKTGEDTGNLPIVMSRIADFYDEEIERNLKLFSTILEPLLLVLMGAVVGVVIISLVLPIFKLTRTIH